MLTLLSGSAFANPLCTLSCHHSTECEYAGPTASFKDFSLTTYAHSGEVCHPNKNFKFYVTTSAFGSTTSGYGIFSEPGTTPTINYVSGHPYYKIEFVDNYHPDNVSGVTGAVHLTFINDYFSTKPKVAIEVFDKNNNILYSGIEEQEDDIDYGDKFEVPLSVDISTSNISHIHITTEDKYGLVGIIYFPLPF